MNFFESIILGLLQGLTEFLPISSSGHLVLFRQLFGLRNPGLFFDVFLHLGTFLAVVVYFFKDFLQIIQDLLARRFKFVLLLIIGTLPAFAVGFFLADVVEKLGEKPLWVASFLVLTGIGFIIVERLAQKSSKPQKTEHEINYRDALAIGFAQSIAILPGVSRSGATIAAGITRSLKRESAAKFSFLLSLPAIIGAEVYTGLKSYLANGYLPFEWNYFAGFLVAFLAGLAAIRFLLSFLKKHSLRPFAFYLILAGIILTVVFLFRK